MLTIGSVQSMGALSTTGTVNNVNNRVCTVYGYTVNNRDCKLYQQSFIKVYIKKNTNHVSAGQEKIGQDHDTEFTRKQRQSTTLQISRLVLKKPYENDLRAKPIFCWQLRRVIQRYCQISTTMSSFIQTRCCRLPIRGKSLPNWTSYTGTAVERYTASLF